MVGSRLEERHPTPPHQPPTLTHRRKTLYAILIVPVESRKSLLGNTAGTSFVEKYFFGGARLEVLRRGAGTLLLTSVAPDIYLEF